MTDQSMEHPTQGRRRRHKSPSIASAAPLLPVARLADRLVDTDGPSDEEGGKEAKRQKSEPTTPISTSSRPPNEYDEVMGITQVDPREAERFEEGVEQEFQDVEEELPREVETKADLGIHGSGVSHGGFGRSSLQECLDGVLIFDSLLVIVLLDVSSDSSIEKQFAIIRCLVFFSDYARHNFCHIRRLIIDILLVVFY